MSQPTVLFGLPPATVTESACQAEGAEASVYEVTWDAELAAKTSDPAEHVTVLEARLSAMTERLDSVYATATDLIADTDVDSVLARITERAATAVRAPRYLLALRTDAESGVRSHQSGFDEAEAREIAHRLLDSALEDLPASWLVADVRSHRHSYGRLAAMSDTSFFPQERYLLELYARYAATALDGATAITEANRGHEEARALLELARALAAATTSQEVAERLGAALPAVVDCDRVAVWLWDPDAQELRCRAVSGEEADSTLLETRFGPEEEYLSAQISNPDPTPRFFDRDTDQEAVRELLNRFDGVAAIAAPIVARGDYLGTITVTVTSDPDRLRPRRELLDRLSGVVAQAGTALQTSRLVDEITHRARHDDLTGLANRTVFAERIEQALEDARENDQPVGLFFVDLDDFKGVNDERGHAAGDELLRVVAQRLSAAVRAGDTVARLGGDEFAIVFSGIDDIGEIHAAALRVAEVFERPFAVDGEEIAVGASIGRATWPEDASEIEDLVRHADDAMYRAKRGTRATS
jgi:diguanylate cyclase (GGDEF)-like protein